MLSIIKEIAQLQTRYSSTNTPEMERRGQLIRSELPKALEEHKIDYAKAITNYSQELAIEGSDGKGNKTQAPWVRLHSNVLSPSATTGFYVVIHFSTNGKQFFVTIGCGASRWDNDKGYLVEYSDEEIQGKVDWAMEILKREQVDISHFSDIIEIGSTHSLPKSFENATVLCKTFDVASFNVLDVNETISRALGVLSPIYDHCSELNDLSQSDISKTEIEAVVNPSRKNPHSRQGYGLTGPERKAVEIRAMVVTHEYLSGKGYSLRDTSAKHSYDYLAKKSDQEIKVEVKGTTSSDVDSVLMTKNEVALHEKEAGSTALAIVSNIKFIERGDNATCKGGVIEYFYPWDISRWTLQPQAYLVVRGTSKKV